MARIKQNKILNKVEPGIVSGRDGFITIGNKQSEIDVRISYRIIQLFSEGLYASPNKAIEELVSNSFDAGAATVHIMLPSDLASKDGVIAVIDNGAGMDEGGLKEHWLIGVSRKRESEFGTLRKRKQIGKFGIGKLATYVLANKLTHISKVNSKFYAVSMDYSQIPTGEKGGIYTEKVVKIPLRVLTESEAKIALSPWLHKGNGLEGIKLFGQGSDSTWTIAIMSDLKEMAGDIRRGRLHWVLQNAMPLRDDFRLFLDGKIIEPTKLAGKLKHWILGRDIKKFSKPAPDELSSTENLKESKESVFRYGLLHPRLGNIYGYAEIYDRLLTGGLSDDIERSHGFFVYINGRLININDEYFGIDRNLLRHGTFSRFRMVVHIDKLDEELRSSRETLREGPLVVIARNLLRSVFNFARTELEAYDEALSPGAQVASRIAGSPGSLIRRPIIGLATLAVQGKIFPQYLNYPKNLKKEEQDDFLNNLDKDLKSSDGYIKIVELAELSQDQGIALLDITARKLQINTLHPFVAYFLDDYESVKRRLPLEIYALSEVLLEADLYQIGIDAGAINDLLEKRDATLRHLARSNGKQNAFLVAQNLVDATTDKNALERQLVAAFDSMGFEAIPLGGPGKPDGRAHAHLAANTEGTAQQYSVSLEAKSKQNKDNKVSAKEVNVSGIIRNRNTFKCEHAIVVGPDFPTTKGKKSALYKEIAGIEEDKKKTSKTVTLIRIVDLARLVRLTSLKRIGLGRVRDLFINCITPEQSKEWIDKLEAEAVQKTDYKEILETIWELQNETPSESIEYASIGTALRRRPKKLSLTKDQIIEICKALSRIAPEMISALSTTVELNQRPDKVLEAVGAAVQYFPEVERKLTDLPNGK